MTSERKKAERLQTEQLLRDAGFRIRNRLYEPDWVRGPGLGNMLVQLLEDRFTMWGPTAELPAILAGPALTPAELKVLDRAMNLMGDCDGSATIAGLLTRAGAAPFTVIPEPGDTVRNSYTGRTGCVYKVDGALTHWSPDGSPYNVASCTAGLEVIKKVPSATPDNPEGG